MFALSVPAIVGLAVVAFIIIVLLAALRSMVNIVQQGKVGVVKRLGEYRKTHDPGLVLITRRSSTRSSASTSARSPAPAIARTSSPRTTSSSRVNATIFTQVVVAEQALFSIANFDVAIDALARTALRSVIGTMTLDESLSERERINTDVQQQMEAVTDKWGIRINRIEIVEIAPPPQILQALALQKQADQEKRARILQSEGQQQYGHQRRRGRRPGRRARPPRASARRRILRAEGNRQAAILEAEGRAQAIETVYAAIKRGRPRPDAGRHPAARRRSAKFADSDNAKIVVPFESRRPARRRPDAQVGARQHPDEPADPAAPGDQRRPRHDLIRTSHARRGVSGSDGYGGPEALRVFELPDRHAGPGEVRIARPRGRDQPHRHLHPQRVAPRDAAASTSRRTWRAWTSPGSSTRSAPTPTPRWPSATG